MGGSAGSVNVPDFIAECCNNPIGPDETHQAR